MDIVLLEWLNNPIGNRTRDHPACSAVSQQNVPPRTPHIQIAILYLNTKSENKFSYKLSVLGTIVKNKSENAVEYMSWDA
jgi:hypothetical protein